MYEHFCEKREPQGENGKQTMKTQWDAGKTLKEGNTMILGKVSRYEERRG
jgi:hypothetical protein